MCVVGKGEISAPTDLVIEQQLYKTRTGFTPSFSTFPPPEQQFEIPEEEAEWLGLSLEEAVEKQRQLEHKVTTQS